MARRRESDGMIPHQRRPSGMESRRVAHDNERSIAWEHRVEPERMHERKGKREAAEEAEERIVDRIVDGTVNGIDRVVHRKGRRIVLVGRLRLDRRLLDIFLIRRAVVLDILTGLLVRRLDHRVDDVLADTGLPQFGDIVGGEIEARVGTVDRVDEGLFALAFTGHAENVVFGQR